MPVADPEYYRQVMRRNTSMQEWATRVQRANLEWSRRYDEQTDVLNGLERDLANAMASKNGWQFVSFLLALCLLACGYVAFCEADAPKVSAQAAFQAQLSSLVDSWQAGNPCLTISQLKDEL